MAELNTEAASRAEAFCELFGEEHGTVLASGAAERDHEAFETARLVVADAGVHERINRSEKLVNAFLLVQIFDDRSVFAGEFLESFFTARIGEAATIEHESATIATFIFRQFAMKRKTADVEHEIVGILCNTQKFFRAEHAFERGDQSRQFDGKLDVVEKPTEIF